MLVIFSLCLLSPEGRPVEARCNRRLVDGLPLRPEWSGQALSANTVGKVWGVWAAAERT